MSEIWSDVENNLLEGSSYNKIWPYYFIFSKSQKITEQFWNHFKPDNPFKSHKQYHVPTIADDDAFCAWRCGACLWQFPNLPEAQISTSLKLYSLFQQ